MIKSLLFAATFLLMQQITASTAWACPFVTDGTATGNKGAYTMASAQKDSTQNQDTKAADRAPRSTTPNP